jgi:hypothetical protein
MDNVFVMKVRNFDELNYGPMWTYPDWRFHVGGGLGAWHAGAQVQEVSSRCGITQLAF